MYKQSLMKVGLLLAVVALVLGPAFLAHAQSGPDLGTIGGTAAGSAAGGTATSTSGGSCASKYAGNVGLEGFINYIGCIIVSSVVPLMFALAFVLFLWGVVQFIMNNADENKRAQGKQFMVWGIVALFVMFSIWGLVQILSNTVDPNAGKIGVPSLPYNP